MNYRRVWPLLILIILLVALAGTAAYAWMWNKGLAESRSATKHRSDLISLEIQSTLARFEYLPALLETTPSVARLLQNPRDPRLQAEVSQHLRNINATAGAELLYLVDRSGFAIAADDALQPGSPFRSSFMFRPYVKDALQSGHGRFFGIGVTTGRPGFYLSYALPYHSGGKQSSEPLGAAVVKIGLSKSERHWANLPGEILVLDNNGVVILSTRERWRYRPLQQLSAQTISQIASSRAYPAALAPTMEWREQEDLGDNLQKIMLDGISYLARNEILEDGAFHLIVLEEVAPLQHRAQMAATAGALGMLVAFLLLALQQMRKRHWQQKLTNQEALQAARDSLEEQVLERTRQLQDAQQELVHAEKMAALGKMSAGLAHEINQPLAALQTLSDNAQVFMQHGRHEEVSGNLARIIHLVQRLAAISQQLKIFAHKTNAPRYPVHLQNSLRKVLSMLEPRLKSLHVICKLQIEPVDLYVLADVPRLEQVLSNLLGNALDAFSVMFPQNANEPPCIEITAWIQASHCHIQIKDNGPGIDAQMLPHLFEPFTTSKPAGSGLGLGLMISDHLIREMGGTLQGDNAPNGGAIFSIVLEQALPGKPL